MYVEDIGLSDRGLELECARQVVAILEHLVELRIKQGVSVSSS